MTAGPRKEKLAILGGGVAAITTAFALSEAGWEDRWESITIYQQGWRIGGKGASGRGVSGRIEEHGLHIWLGFYENAFRLLRQCYDELGRPPSMPLATIDDAFTKASCVGMEEYVEGEWRDWVATFPEDNRRPGVADDWDEVVSVWEYVVRLLRLMKTAVDSFRSGDPHHRHVSLHPLRPSVSTTADVRLRPPPGQDEDDPIFHTLDDVRQVATAVQQQLVGAAFEALALALDAAESLDASLVNSNSPVLEVISRELDVVVRLFRRWVELLEDTDARRRWWYVIELSAANVRGIIAHGLIDHPSGFDALDEYDYVDWLLDQGVAPEVAQSAFVRTVAYDLPFSYLHGDWRRPRAAAGASLRLQARIYFDYKGAIMWKMMAGMGDTVFAPYFEVLRRRGVRFEFFHQVQSLHLDDAGSTVERITVRRQAELREDLDEYDPLVMIQGLPCWPSEPRVEQLAEPVSADQCEWWYTADRPGREMELVRGQDFDRIVFGISLGAVPLVASELVERIPRWKAMVEGIPTCQTQAFQIWLSSTTEDLGWHHGWSTVGGYVEPFDTWGDMSHLIGREEFPEGSVRSIAYFCNVLPDDPDPTARSRPDYLERQRALVREYAVEFLRHNVSQYWPKGTLRYPDDFDWSLLVVPNGATGASSSEAGAPTDDERFATQFWRANVDPSERYVLAAPGNTRHRLLPGESGVTNLVMAGDWTYTKINAGCVESATISGLLAAHALTGRPRLEQIAGFLGP